MERSSLWKVAAAIGLIGIWGLVSWQQSKAPSDDHDDHDDAPTAQVTTAQVTPAQVTPAQKPSSDKNAIAKNAIAKNVVTRSNSNAKETRMGELKIEELQVGTGEEAKAGQRVTVHYRGTLDDGKQFDASYDRGQPFQFNLGAGEVIKGWDQGVAGMKVGGKRRLTIPSELGYGARGAGGAIPPNATLHFDVELLKVN